MGSLDHVDKVGEVFSHSVRKLCKNDYKPNTISRWRISKPPECRVEYIKNSSLWIAKVGNEIAGYLISVPGEIIALFVHSSYTGLGVGKSLAKKGVTGKIKLEFSITVAPFYNKLGFK